MNDYYKHEPQPAVNYFALANPHYNHVTALCHAQQRRPARKEPSMNVTRYEETKDEGMKPHQFGQYVDYDDYSAVLHELLALKLDIRLKAQALLETAK